VVLLFQSLCAVLSHLAAEKKEKKKGKKKKKKEKGRARSHLILLFRPPRLQVLQSERGKGKKRKEEKGK